MAFTLAYDAHTEIGLVRSNNQDSAYTSPRMLMVADGMGGAAAGDLASSVAVWELRETDERLDELVADARAAREASGAELPTNHDDHPGELVDVFTVLAQTLARANERLVHLVDDDPQLSGMGTTVCGMVLAGDQLAVVNIGDSRAYLVRDGEMHRVTRDHSWVQTLVDEGRLTEEEALEHPHRSLVMRVLTGSSQHEPDFGWLDIREGDRLLICSDGLCGLATDATIASVTTAGLPRAEAIEQLVGIAHAAGGHDNITIILADIETDGPAGAVATLGAASETLDPAGAEATAAMPVQTAPTHPLEAQERFISETERYALSGRRRASTWVKAALALLIPLLVLAGGGYGWYQYTQTQLFIGPADTQVALYRGIPGTLLGRPLSTLEQTEETRIGDLPPYYAERVHATIKVEDRAAAESTLVELREKAARCIAQREERSRATQAPEPTPTPTPSATPDPSGTPSPGVTPLPSATASQPTWPLPSPTATPVTAPEDC